MNKQIWVAVFSLCITNAVFSQTLFTYGKYKVDAKEFLRAFNKNNSTKVNAGNKAKAIKDYLDLYIKSKLKVRDAYDKGYDTLSQLKAEVESLRSQIIDSYLTDPEIMDKLVKEAFQRSQKDIHVAHIFIAFDKKGTDQIDTVNAKHKLDEVMKKLQQGEEFSKIAEQYSDDPSAKNNKGDIGFITVFTLPYPLESVIYSTAVGKYSSPYRSKAGYHIFKNLGERKAAGKMRMQQILLAFPPNADSETKNRTEHLADSLYQRIIAGDDFGKLASAFSNDFVTAANSGKMPDFYTGQYDPAFENEVLSLSKDNAVSKPFVTTHGYHIVKRISITPVISDPKNKTYQQELRQRITNDSRSRISQEIIYNRIIKLAGSKKLISDENALWALTDSLIDRKPLGTVNKIPMDAPVFRIGDSTVTVPSWVNYAQTYRFKLDGSGRKPYSQVMDEYMHTVAMQYYRDHLEKFNDDFRFQMNEFMDGNLFFESMQREVWNKAQTDSIVLKALYEKNKSQYNWKPSADAVMFFCSDQNICKNVYELLKKDPSRWKAVSEELGEKVVADSARYEWKQIPGGTTTPLKPGMITSLQINKDDSSASFAYIIKLYPQPMPRTFSEARGIVINDYQNILEQKWLAGLRKKYPVVINQKVLAEISK